MKYDYLKRLFDTLAALVLLILLLPLLLFISLMIVINMGFPVLFQHTRPGLNGTPFKLLKFRTMTESVNSNDELLADEQRITSLGKFLRRTSIDELPQLINVIKGDMSIVGPRPLLMEYMDRYSKEQARRHEVRPGITGWAQVNGRNAINWGDKFRYDVWYVDNYGPGVDWNIMCSTIMKVLKGEGISQVDHMTTRPFQGGEN